jgi:hypothetical protein
MTAPGILGSTVTRRAKKRKNSSSARHYDEISFRFHTAKTQFGSGVCIAAVEAVMINTAEGDASLNRCLAGARVGPFPRLMALHDQPNDSFGTLGIVESPRATSPRNAN